MKNKKFRAWDPYRGDRGIMLVNHTLYTIGKTGLYLHEDLIWMQYTGLKDKNGVEIYEGDIVYTKFDGRYIKEIVSIDIDGVFPFSHKAILKCYCEFWESEVIGNIYQNPELLEQ